MKAVRERLPPRLEDLPAEGDRFHTFRGDEVADGLILDNHDVPSEEVD